MAFFEVVLGVKSFGDDLSVVFLPVAEEPVLGSVLERVVNKNIGGGVLLLLGEINGSFLPEIIRVENTHFRSIILWERFLLLNAVKRSHLSAVRTLFKMSLKRVP